MAHVESGGSGRKTSLELNLVPVIDLMSVLITFLLITAVWSQVSLLQINNSIYGKKDPNKPQPPIPPEMNVVIKVDIKEGGYVFTVGTQSVSIPKKANEYDDELLFEQLKAAKEAHPKKEDAIVSVADVVTYDKLVRGMDLILKSGFKSISVATGGPN